MNLIMLLAAISAVNTTTTLSPIIVEASYLDKTKNEIASHVEVIERDEIDSSGAVNTVELLEKRANLFIRKLNSNPSLAQLSMRGYGANSFARVKIIVDGIELNNADMLPQNLMSVPIGSIERIEIFHGPQTVLHGGDASAGVINVVSNSDSYERTSELEAHGGNFGKVGTHVGTRGGIEDEGLTYYADFDYDRSDGWRKNSWHELWSAKSGIKHHFDNEAWWAMNAFYSNSRYGLPAGLYDGNAFGIDYGGWQSRARDADDTTSKAKNNTYGISLWGKGIITDENVVKAEFSFRNRKSKSYEYLVYDVYAFDYKLKYTNTSPLHGHDNQFDIGTDLKHDIIDADAYSAAKNFYGVDNDFTRFSGAIFVNDEFWLLEGLSVFGGARGEWFYSENECHLRHDSETHSDANDSVAAEIGVNWHPHDSLKLFTKWSRFYHAPLADEMFSSYGLANMSLKPEAGYNTELGIDWTFMDDFNFNLTGFHTELDDEIIYLNFANANAPDRTARTGFEGALTWSHDDVGSAGIMYSYVYARFTEGDYEDNDVPMIPRQQLRVFGEYYLIDEVAVQGGYRFVGNQRYGGDFANEGGSLPSYGIFDLGIRVVPMCEFLNGVTFAFTIDNLFDKRYCDYGEYFNAHYVYPACGRSFMFTIRYEF